MNVTDAQVALYGVLAALIIGFGGIAVTIWQTFANAKREQDLRMQERRTDGYVRLLQLVSLRGHGEQDAIRRWLATPKNGDLPLSDQRPAESTRDEEDSEASALVAAYASRQVTDLHFAWRNSMKDLDSQWEKIEKARCNGRSREVKELTERLGPLEVRARGRLAARIRSELWETSSSGPDESQK